MSELRVQLAVHFTVDPNSQVIGAIAYPEQVQRTVSVGTDIIEMAKVDFKEGFVGVVFTAIDAKLNEIVNDVLRKAKPSSRPIKQEQPPSVAFEEKRPEGDGENSNLGEEVSDKTQSAEDGTSFL